MSWVHIYSSNNYNSTSQAGHTRKGFANWQAVSGWLFTTLQAVYRSGSAPISAPARWEHIPNPEIAQVRATRFHAFTKMEKVIFTRHLSFIVKIDS